LSTAEDEYYVQEMQKAASYELWDTFLELEKENKTDIGFYFEMADFFFANGKEDKAQELMYNAIELCRGSSDGLKLAAYLYEKWKWFDKAIAVYKGILSQDENNLRVKRDLALAYFQNRDFEAAVKTYYSIITATDENNYSSNVKGNALAEMNAILALHKNEFDISYINHNLFKLLPVDLRITLESNYDYINNVQFIEPGNTISNYRNPNTVNGGRYTGNDYYRYNYDLSEYAVKTAPAGRYRIKVDAYNNYSHASQIPMYVRVVAFKNFHKDNMEIEVKLFDLDNQYGVVELDDVKW
jgi:tetratricopeptide (TPR) repeat protein